MRAVDGMNQEKIPDIKHLQRQQLANAASSNETASFVRSVCTVTNSRYWHNAKRRHCCRPNCKSLQFRTRPITNYEQATGAVRYSPVGIFYVLTTQVNQEFINCRNAQPSLKADRTEFKTVNRAYTVSQKKQDTKLLPITSLNINRFSKFF